MRDLQFADMHRSARVAGLGTLSAVARERDAPVSQELRNLARIEKACGARLIHRSPHGPSLIAEGSAIRTATNPTEADDQAEWFGTMRTRAGAR